MHWWKHTLLLAVVLLSGSGMGFAQDEPSTQDAQSAPSAGVEEPQANQQPAPQPAPTSFMPPVEETPAEPAMENQPVEEPAAVDASVEDQEELGADQEEPAEEEDKGYKQTILIQTRSGISYLHAYTEGDMPLEMGLELSFQSKDLGVMVFWYYHHPLDFDDVMMKPKVDFSYQLGFGFQYYPFGEGPSGLYTGPGFCAWHLNKDPDPIQAAIAPDMDHLNKEVRLYTFKRGNQPYDMVGPFWMVGYRYLIPEIMDPVSFVIGVDMRMGAAFSDRLEYQDHSFYWSLSPNIGMAF